ncbi:uncharacterized protein BO97DRAFT_14840 [Aspergillus homomorphus CBS 101889]|uniref:Uncharacterized protein n=1 Tax=Aspergillus homomorphus (strain CBS 101889) TaxID=1450537 RepID=A0A395ICR5_ASPHC|nr:hypothetical protein BO97DRAFT_14840 [Aspergillus homomorphus CBS 101889]RAL17795.1 hypothetical protein BO97DRAFT_14840 [Aspergillus homomorphus CBS 101889]
MSFSPAYFFRKNTYSMGLLTWFHLCSFIAKVPVPFLCTKQILFQKISGVMIQIHVAKVVYNRSSLPAFLSHPSPMLYL